MPKPPMTLKRRIKRARYDLTKKPRVHLLHIPKTGGSAVRAALVGSEFAGPYAVRMYPHKTRLHDIPEGERVVFALRHPVTRFESAFSSRQRQGLPKNNNPWNPLEAAVFARFESANELALGLSSDDPTTRELAEAALNGIGHFRPYKRWLGTLNHLKSRADDVFFVLRQEHLTEDFDRLAKVLEIDAALPTDDVGAHRSPKHHHGGLDKEARQNLRQWYASDFRIWRWAKRHGQTLG